MGHCPERLIFTKSKFSRNGFAIVLLKGLLHAKQCSLLEATLVYFSFLSLRVRNCILTKPLSNSKSIHVVAEKYKHSVKS